mgnify:CR=1 FL=1
MESKRARVVLSNFVQRPTTSETCTVWPRVNAFSISSLSACWRSKRVRCTCASPLPSSSAAARKCSTYSVITVTGHSAFLGGAVTVLLARNVFRSSTSSASNRASVAIGRVGFLATSRPCPDCAKFIAVAARTKSMKILLHIFVRLAEYFIAQAK